MIIRFKVTDIKFDGEGTLEYKDINPEDWPREATVLVDDEFDNTEEQIEEELADIFDFGCAIISYHAEKDEDQSGLNNR